MDLLEFKQQNNLTLQKMADLLGIDGINPRRTVSRYIGKERTPRLDMALKIVSMTRGKVSLEDLGVKNGNEKK